MHHPDDAHLERLPRHIIQDCIDQINKGLDYPPPHVRLRAFVAVSSALQRGLDPYKPNNVGTMKTSTTCASHDLVPTSKPQDSTSSSATELVAKSAASSAPLGLQISCTSYGLPHEEGTGSTSYTASIVGYPSPSSSIDLFQTITAMPTYLNFSLEELRLIDYTQGRRYDTASGVISGFGSSKYGGFCLSTGGDPSTLEDFVKTQVEAQIKPRIERLKSTAINKIREIREENSKLFRERQKELDELRATHQACVFRNRGDEDSLLEQRASAIEVANSVPVLAEAILNGTLQPDEVVEQLAEILMKPVDTTPLVQECTETTKTVNSATITENTAVALDPRNREERIQQAKLEILKGRLEWHMTLERIAKEQLKAALAQKSRLEDNVAQHEKLIALQEQKITEQAALLAEQMKNSEQSQNDAEVTRKVLLEEYWRLGRTTPRK